MEKTIQLPAGHKWAEIESSTASETCFECKKCLSAFVYDGVDGSYQFIPSEESCVN